MAGFFFALMKQDRCRAYSVLEIKAVDDEKRLIEGIATTPTPDRMGDVIVTEGVEFRLPLPLLYQHDAKNPIGAVTKAKVGKGGIEVQAKVLPAGIDSDVDRAWSKIKNGLVRGLSIGFRTLEESFDKQLNGFRILRSEWLELSAVTIPANAEATITSVKAFDLEAQPHLGKGRGIVSLDTRQHPALAGKNIGNAMLTVEEQIKNAETQIAASEAKKAAIVEKCGQESRTRNEEEKTEYQEAADKTKELLEHVDMLKAYQKELVKKATVITSETVKDEKSGIAARQSQIITVKKNDPPGIGMARMLIALINAKFNPHYAAELAAKHWPDNPELPLAIKATVEAADTTTSGFASQLIPSAVQSDFLEYLRPATIFGKINGWRFMPFNSAAVIQTGTGTVYWVGEAKPKPVTSLTVDRVTMTWAKVAAIMVVTKELARFSQPSAEAIIRDDLRDRIVEKIDSTLFSTDAAVSGVSPAGILNSITPITPSGTNAAALRVDLNNLLNNFAANNVPLSSLTLVMSASQAIALSLMVTDLGVRQFDTIDAAGGTLNGIPVVVSEAIGTKIVALSARNILVADDGAVTLDASDQASIEMSDTPIQGDTSPTTNAVLKSMFQNNLIAIRAELFKTWARGRTAAVEYINGNAYVPS